MKRTSHEDDIGRTAFHLLRLHMTLKHTVGSIEKKTVNKHLDK